ncbi:MAG: N-6 DNA methylase [Phycisphaerae bacterium]|nr:N-6 DNA methylase [Phycisphaerae bacterium]
MTRATNLSLSAVNKPRRLGQVFTPRPVADWMARWVCAIGPRRVLDPAVGRGVFVEAVEALLGDGRLATTPRIDACEIDARTLHDFATARRCPGQRAWPGEPSRRCVPAPRRSSVHCRQADFITACFRGTYDAIIANPPYIRHHAMRYDEALLRTFDRICRRRLSRMTNLYGLFLIKIWTLLGQGGRAAVITPAEWLNADFGVPIKAYLLEENAIDAIVHFDHAANVFDGALTTAAITLLRRSRSEKDPVNLCHVRSVKALSARTLEDGTRVDSGNLAPRVKWTPLFTIRKTGSTTRCPKGTATRPILADIARCTRGIATGANDYFTLRESDRRLWKIDLADLRLCITKAHQIPGDRLARTDVQRLIEADQRIYLLHPRPRLTAAVRRYLDEGRRRGIDQRYLPSHRPVWYMPERREPAPVLVSVFARGSFRFVLNEAGVLNLTAYHAIYPRTSGRACVQALFGYVTGPQAHRLLQDHRRIYADGLLKLEPRDVEALPIPDQLCHR